MFKYRQDFWRLSPGPISKNCSSVMREIGSVQSETFPPEVGSNAEEIKPRRSGSRGVLQGSWAIQSHSLPGPSPCFTDIKYSETQPFPLTTKRLISFLLHRRVADAVRPP